MYSLYIWLKTTLCLVLRLWHAVSGDWLLAAEITLGHCNRINRTCQFYQIRLLESNHFTCYSNNVLSLFSESPILGLIVAVSLIIALTVHEWAHARVADHFGDPTPRMEGRVTLNPLAHLEPLGVLFFILAGFGWGKPVMINPNNFSSRLHELWVALAGPASNIVLAFLGLLLLQVIPEANQAALIIWVSINISLAAFNLIPIPPLDGSYVVAHFWPEYRSPRFLMYGSIALLLLVAAGSPILRALMDPLITAVTFLATAFNTIPFPL